MACVVDFVATQMTVAMSQVMTHAECVEQMWDQYATKVLKSSCVLDNRLSLEQWSNQKFTYTQDKRDLLAGMPFAINAEGNLLPIDTSDLEGKTGL